MRRAPEPSYKLRSQEEMRHGLALWFNLKPTKACGRTDALRASRCRRWFYVVALAALSTHFLLAANGNSNGGLKGSVVDDSGHPVAGARVLVSYAPSIKAPISAPPVITGPLAVAVSADASGLFQVDTIGAGQYIACAETLTPGYLDPSMAKFLPSRASGPMPGLWRLAGKSWKAYWRDGCCSALPITPRFPTSTATASRFAKSPESLRLVQSSGRTRSLASAPSGSGRPCPAAIANI
jgi:hypothetical protein